MIPICFLQWKKIAKKKHLSHLIIYHRGDWRKYCMLNAYVIANCYNVHTLCIYKCAKIRLHKKLCMSFNLFSENVKLFFPFFFAKIRLHKKCMLCMSFNLFSENVKLFSPLFAKIRLHKKCMSCMSFNLFSENVELFSLLHNNKEYIRNPNCLLNVHVLKEKRWWILVLYNNTTEKCKTYNKVNDLPT